MSSFNSGTTVTITAVFKDSDGTPFAPTKVTVKIYNAGLAVVETASAKLGATLGEYFYDFVVKKGVYMAEFKGIDPEGYPSVGRAELRATSIFS